MDFMSMFYADGASVCLDYRAWLLLRELVLRIPLTTVARLLSAHNFVATAQSTLQWLAEQCHILHESFSSGDGSRGSVTSFVLDGRSPLNVLHPSKKRKRDEGMPAATLRVPKDIRYLYTAISSNLIQLQDITKDESQGYAVEHLKAALRSPPEDAAAILACAAAIAGFLLRYRCDHFKMDSNGAWVLPMVRHWQSQLTSIGGDLNVPVHVSPIQSASISNTNVVSKLAFSEHCFADISRLVRSICELHWAEDETEQISTLLKDLLRTHILRPSRSSCLNSLRPRDDRNPDIPAGLLETLFAPLMDSLADEKYLDRDALDSAALLFELAAEDSRQMPPKGRRNESTWLQRLFNHIMQKAYAYENYESDDTRQADIIDFCVKMLEISVRLKVQLETAALEKVIRPVFHGRGLFTENEWSLVNLCMELDVNVFVKPSGRSLVNQARLQPMPDDVLSLLLHQVSKEGHKPVSVEANPLFRLAAKHPYAIILSTIVIPLVKAFAQVRELPRLLEIWQEQLVRRSLMGKGETLSVWMDDELLQTVAQLVEPTLTTSEVKKRLNQVENALESLSGNASIEPLQVETTSALLLTLESVLLGCSGEQTLQDLEERVIQLYKLILNLATDGTERHHEFQSRCWRVMTLINERWSLPHPSLDSENDAIWTAKRAVDKVSVFKGGRQSYMEALHAFRFMLSMAKYEVARMDAIQATNPNGNTANPIGTIIDHILDESHAAHCPVWDGHDESIVDNTVFCLACCAQLIIVPQTLW